MQPTRDTSTLDLIFIDMVEYYEIPAILTPLSTSNIMSSTGNLSVILQKKEPNVVFSVCIRKYNIAIDNL